MSSAIDGGDRVLQSMIVVIAASSNTTATTGRIVLAHVVAAVDLDLDVQSVVAEQDSTGLRRIAAIADQLRRIGESTGVVAEERPISRAALSSQVSATLSKLTTSPPSCTA